jgi:hypothetical protein
MREAPDAPVILASSSRSRRRRDLTLWDWLSPSGESRRHSCLSWHWSGCPAGCGNHALGDIGLLGKNIRIDSRLVDAVDVFIGGKPARQAGDDDSGGRTGRRSAGSPRTRDPNVSKTRHSTGSSDFGPPAARESSTQADIQRMSFNARGF